MGDNRKVNQAEQRDLPMTRASSFWIKVERQAEQRHRPTTWGSSFRMKVEELPAEARGQLLGILGVSACLSMAVQGASVILLVASVRAVVRQGDYRSVPMVRAASPALPIATGLVLAQRLSHPFVLRGFDRWVARRIIADAR